VAEPLFPDWFFDRADPGPDAAFYGPPRLVTHIDEGAIAAVGDLYAELSVEGEVLDLMSSWVSHFRAPPRRLVGLGMNAAELAANPALAEHVVHDLNVDPALPFPDAGFDDVTCCVSVDYLVRPVEVFGEVARVLRPGGRFVVTFSNRCFPTKAIRGWLATDDRGHLQIVAAYFAAAADRFRDLRGERRPTPPGGDPLYAVWAHRSSGDGPEVDRDRPTA
jgi:SAM-dependent methyltransferase